MKLREPPLTLEKTYRVITFLHYVLKEIPITTTNSSNSGFPLGPVIKDLSLALSLRSNTPHVYSIWIIIIQFMLSCLKSVPQQTLFHAGVTTPVILGVIKQVLLGMTSLPEKNMNLIQQKCFSVGRELLNLFLIRDPSVVKESDDMDMDSSIQNFTATSGNNNNNNSMSAISFYDVIYSVSN